MVRPRFRIVAVLVMMATLLAERSSAQSPSCDPTPGSAGSTCFPWGFTDLTSRIGAPIYDLSKDGSSVAGSGGSVVFRWKVGSGLDVLAGDAGSTFSYDTRFSRTTLSEDGRYLVGKRIDSSTNPATLRAFRWEVDTGTTIILPSGPTVGLDDVFPGFTNGTIVPADFAAVSADGDTIVGVGVASGLTDMGVPFTDSFWAFRWTASGGTDDEPQPSFTTRFTPIAIAGNGLDVGGRIDVPGSEEAVLWRPNMVTNLGIADSAVTALSYDGLVVGGIRKVSTFNRVGIRWTQAGGALDLDPEVRPRAMSDDGNVIASVNFSPPAPFQFDEPWVWTNIDGDIQLFEFLDTEFGILDGDYGDFGLDSLALVSGNGHVFSLIGAQWVTNVHPLKAVMLGDSFSSGEGVPPFDPNTELPGINECHRSTRAYARLLRPRTSKRTLRDFARGASPRPAYSWDFHACSGAETVHVLSAANGGETQYPNSAEDPVPQLDKFGTDNDTDIVTITIGGNDTFFEDIAFDCVVKEPCSAAESFEAGQTWEDYLFGSDGHIRTTVKDAVQGVLQDIKGEAPNAAIFAFGYPRLFAAELGQAGNCTGAPNITIDEQKWIIKAANLLNQVIAQAAREVGVHFIPVAQDFSGHERCSSSGQSWIVPIHLVSIQDIVPKVTYKYSLHPNELGQAQYAKSFQKFIATFDVDYVHGFYESGMPKNPPPQP